MNEKIRCTYSKKWRTEFTGSPYRNKERYGLIVGFSKDGKCFRVQWDNVKTKEYYAICFIEIVEVVKIEPIPEEKVSEENAIPQINNPYNFYIHPEDKIKQQ